MFISFDVLQLNLDFNETNFLQTIFSRKKSLATVNPLVTSYRD